MGLHCRAAFTSCLFLITCLLRNEAKLDALQLAVSAYDTVRTGLRNTSHGSYLLTKCRAATISSDLLRCSMRPIILIAFRLIPPHFTGVLLHLLKDLYPNTMATLRNSSRETSYHLKLQSAMLNESTIDRRSCVQSCRLLLRKKAWARNMHAANCALRILFCMQYPRLGTQYAHNTLRFRNLERVCSQLHG